MYELTWLMSSTDVISVSLLLLRKDRNWYLARMKSALTGLKNNRSFTLFFIDILVYHYNPKYSQTCVKQAPMGKPKTGCLRQLLA